jgi:hypothetical protein
MIRVRIKVRTKFLWNIDSIKGKYFEIAKDKESGDRVIFQYGHDIIMEEGEPHIQYRFLEDEENDFENSDSVRTELDHINSGEYILYNLDNDKN